MDGISCLMYNNIPPPRQSLYRAVKPSISYRASKKKLPISVSVINKMLRSLP